MMLSSYSQYARTGGGKDFGAMSLNYDNPWRYDDLVAMYEAAFGAENVIVLPYELMRDDMAAFLRNLEGRLDLSPFDLVDRRPNPSLSGLEMRWYPRISRFVRRLPLPSDLKEKLFQRYTDLIFHGRLSGLVRVLNHFRPSSPVDLSCLPTNAIENCRGLAETLRHRPEYAPYLADYLLDR